jgi:hypothetical protein
MMKNKFKLLSDYQYVSSEKRIFLIKAGTIIEDYAFKTKGVDIKIDKEIVDVNPQLFQLLDWKTELLSHLKVSKIAQPSQVSKKLIPFIEDILLSTSNSSDDKYNDILELENSIKRKELRLKDSEDDINIRLNILEKRELTFKDDIINFDKKDDILKEKLLELKELESKLSKKANDLNKMERGIELKALESSTDIESKYLDIQVSINNDIENINKREKEINKKTKELTKIEIDLSKREEIIIDRERELNIKEEELFIYREEINRISSEIEEWENLHWKFKGIRKPPSCE